MDKAELKYNELKYKLNFKVKSKVEEPILALKAKIQELKATATVTKTKYVVPVKGSSRIREIPNWINNPPKNEKSTKKKEKTYQW